MTILERYLQKHSIIQQQINSKPSDQLGLCVVIPCYNEDTIIPVLRSLANCDKPKCDVEVIVVLNGREHDTEEVWLKHVKIEQEFHQFLSENKSNFISFHLIKQLNIPQKLAGVGYARKIGMDESIRRFLQVGQERGIICCLDVDCTVEQNYLVEVENLFKTKNAKACSIRFEHPLDGNEFNVEVYKAIAQYELYLHYHLVASRFSAHPFAYHTIGSAMAVRADVYAMQGGMNQRQAGEDFYFLQKVIPLGKFYELNTTCVYPSPRQSERVPFGTGMSIQKILQSKAKQWLVYHPQAYIDLKNWFDNALKWYEHQQIDLLWNNLSKTIRTFLTYDECKHQLYQIFHHTSNAHSFRKRFFRWFNMFQVIKFLNYAHEYHYSKIHVLEAANLMLRLLEKKYEINDITSGLNVYRSLVYQSK